MAELHADLVKQMVPLAGIAAAASSDYVVPGVQAATGTGHNVVDVLGLGTAVLAAVAVSGENRAKLG